MAVDDIRRGQGCAYVGVVGSAPGSLPYTIDFIASGAADTWCRNAWASADNTTPMVVPYSAGGSPVNPALSAVNFVGDYSQGSGDPTPQGSRVAEMLAVGKSNASTTTKYGQTGAQWAQVQGGYTGPLSFTAGATLSTSSKVIALAATPSSPITNGMPVSGTGIPANTVVVSVSGLNVTLNNTPTVNASETLTFIIGGVTAAQLSSNPLWANYAGTPGDTFIFDGSVEVFDLQSYCAWNESVTTVYQSGLAKHEVRMQMGIATGQNLGVSTGTTHVIGLNMINEGGSGVEGIAYYASAGTSDWGVWGAGSGFYLETNGTLNTISDPAVKTNIEKIKSVRAIIDDIHPITFKWATGMCAPSKRDCTHWGFASTSVGDVGGVKEAFERRGLDFAGASEIKETRPIAMPDEARRGKCAVRRIHRQEHTGRTFTTLDHGHLLAVNWRGTQEAFAEIDELKAMVSALQAQVAALRPPAPSR
jgi:hypothetical protein